MPVSVCRIAHMSDLHIAEDGLPVFDLVNTVDAAERVVMAINALHPKPDIVLVTGDITHAGGDDAVQRALSILQKLDVPYLIANGNHDCRLALARALGMPLAVVERDGLVNVTECGGIRCIALDTVVDDPRKSEFSERQLQYLEKVLSEGKGQASLIFMHHPPFDTGISWLDEMKPEVGRHEFGVLLQKFPEVRAICCGHLHRPMRGVWYGVPVFAAPSVMNPVDFDVPHEGDVITLKIKSPSGFVVYDFTATYQFSTTLHFLDDYSENWQDARNDTVIAQMIAE